MMDIYLKAENRDQLMAALMGCNFPFQDGEIIPTTHDYALDEVGVLVDEEGNQKPGYHANLRVMNGPFGDSVLEELAEADVVITPPATPDRVWED